MSSSLDTARQSNGPDKSSGRSKSNRPGPVAVALLVVIGVLSAAGWWFFSQQQKRERLFVSGRIEGYETDLGAKIGGRVDAIAVREGDPVEKGQLLATIADEDIQAQLRAAGARVAGAMERRKRADEGVKVVEAQIQELRFRVQRAREESGAEIEEAQAAVAQSQAELNEASARLAEATAELELARIRFQRHHKLVRDGAVTKDEFDQADTNVNTAAAIVKSRTAAVDASKRKLEAARASLNKAQAKRFDPRINAAQLSAAQKQLVQAQYDLVSAREEVAEALADKDKVLADIAYLKIRSPIDGIVTARPVEPGAVVVAGDTLLSVIDLQQVYLRGYVPEARIGAVRVGQRAQVLLDSFPEKPFDGRVIEIDPVASFTPENIYFKDDRVKQVFGIKVAIANPDRFAKPGMPADAEIFTDVPESPK